MLDDNGDGQIASGLFLGVGLAFDTNSADNPMEVLEVTPTRYLNSSVSSSGKEAIRLAETHHPLAITTESCLVLADR